MNFAVRTEPVSKDRRAAKIDSQKFHRLTFSAARYTKAGAQTETERAIRAGIFSVVWCTSVLVLPSPLFLVHNDGSGLLVQG